jgi:hypothetical protein
MNPILEQKLARFVDRSAEMENFIRMLEDASWPRPIMIVWGDGGMGKSSLILRMKHECSLREINKAHVEWRELRADDYLAVMRHIRDDIGAGHFAEFTQTVNFFTDPQATQKFELIVNAQGAISVADNVVVKDSGHIGSITGVAIRDLMINIPRADLGISDSERMARLTDKFLQDLNLLAAERPVVIFLDALEKATETTRAWVWTELLASVRDGRIGNVKFVIGGRTPPAIDEKWRSLIEEAQLLPLQRDHIREYLIKRNFSSTEVDGASEWILAGSSGCPLTVANMVDAFLRRREQVKTQ